MATKIYDTGNITLDDGEELYLTPLKIRYLREFMSAFDVIKEAKSDREAIAYLCDCARVAMKQYCPRIKTIEDVEDNFDLPTIYHILDIAGGIKISTANEQPVKKQATDSGASWDELDLAELEAEVFQLGIWKDYEDLELSLSMPELLATLKAKRELDYKEKKFLAAIQGVDLDKQAAEDGKGGNAWEEMKARVFSKGQASSSDDILALQGQNAQKAGFGIGMGLSYEKVQ